MAAWRRRRHIDREIFGCDLVRHTGELQYGRREMRRVFPGRPDAHRLTVRHRGHELGARWRAKGRWLRSEWRVSDRYGFRDSGPLASAPDARRAARSPGSDLERARARRSYLQ